MASGISTTIDGPMFPGTTCRAYLAPASRDSVTSSNTGGSGWDRARLPSPLPRRCLTCPCRSTNEVTAPPFWRWPAWGHVGYAVILGGAVNLWFALIYGGADFVTARRSFRLRLYFDAELAMPFVPATVLVYLSIYLLFWSAPFIL